MYFDRLLMKKGADVGLVFVSPLGVRMRYMVRIHFPSSNNVAEYEAFINGLRIAIEFQVLAEFIAEWTEVQMPPAVVDQVMKELSCHNAKIASYCREVHQLEDKFDGLVPNHILRCLNEVADALAKAASG